MIDHISTPFGRHCPDSRPSQQRFDRLRPIVNDFGQHASSSK
jgi:hypothetical protein